MLHARNAELKRMSTSCTQATQKGLGTKKSFWEISPCNARLSAQINTLTKHQIQIQIQIHEKH